MAKRRTYQVKDLARASGVSVRTLHHYDQIGLLVPTDRTSVGYRIYVEEDLLRLQQILIQRELGLSLEQIKRSLDDPTFDHRAALQRQRREIEARAERATQMLQAIDAALELLSNTEGKKEKMTNKQETALFDGFAPRLHEEEVHERWGNTDAYAESARRTAHYTPDEWREYKTENETIMNDAAELFRSQESATSERAMVVAERHRISIDRWFYPCSPQMHGGLADMYEADERFQKNIDKYAPGLTLWLSEAIRANAQGRARS